MGRNDRWWWFGDVKHSTYWATFPIGPPIYCFSLLAQRLSPFACLLYCCVLLAQRLSPFALYFTAVFYWRSACPRSILYCCVLLAQRLSPLDLLYCCVLLAQRLSTEGGGGVGGAWKGGRKNNP